MKMFLDRITYDIRTVALSEVPAGEDWRAWLEDCTLEERAELERRIEVGDPWALYEVRVTASSGPYSNTVVWTACDTAQDEEDFVQRFYGKSREADEAMAAAEWALIESVLKSAGHPVDDLDEMVAGCATKLDAWMVLATAYPTAFSFMAAV